MTFFKDFRLYSLVAVISVIAACNYTLKRDSSSMSFDLNVSDLIIETPDTAEVVSGNFQLKQDGTGKLGCQIGADGQPTTGSGATFENVGSFSVFLAARFSYPFSIKPSSMKVLLKKSGNTNASASIEVVEATEAEPLVESVVMAADPVSVNTIPVLGSFIDFSFGSSPQVLTANKNYAVIIKGTFGSGTLDGSNNFAWGRGNNVNDCSSYELMQLSVNSGTTWMQGSSRPYFYFEVPTFKNGGSGYWILDAGREFNWNLKTLTVGENSADAANGSIRYSIGVGSDALLPTYSYTNLSLSQVKELDNLVGQFLYIRVNLESANQGFTNATLSSGSIGGL